MLGVAAVAAVFCAPNMCPVPTAASAMTPALTATAAAARTGVFVVVRRRRRDLRYPP